MIRFGCAYLLFVMHPFRKRILPLRGGLVQPVPQGADGLRGTGAEGQGGREARACRKIPPAPPLLGSSARRRCLRVSVASSSPAQVFKCQKESQGHNAAGCDEGGSDTHRPKSITAPNRTQDASQTAHGLGNPHDPSLLVYAAVA